MHAHAWFLRGHCARLQEKLEESQKHYETGLRYAPHDAQAHRELAGVLQQLGNAPEAERRLRYAAQLDSQLSPDSDR
jgi:Flp pilus assembly protein TadD